MPKLSPPLQFDARGLIPAVVQDAHTLQVLMVAYMNEEALRRTLETGEAHFWSRSRQELWHKGATSGNIQKVIKTGRNCVAIAANRLGLAMVFTGVRHFRH